MGIPPRSFDIPELLSLVCGFSDVSDCVQVSRVCRAGFGAASPFIWKHVVGVQNLLALLPGFQIIEKNRGQ
ncbi:hypothetical protein BDV93DRAFT_525668 [Ceratobasidium sp. AG-I]|nr:hypothetical protein BDV93DRAFT_525668 [Ceratobasidium sp. AG-I]